jgi:hypothetical protein
MTYEEFRKLRGMVERPPETLPGGETPGGAAPVSAGESLDGPPGGEAGSRRGRPPKNGAAEQ